MNEQGENRSQHRTRTKKLNTPTTSLLQLNTHPSYSLLYFPRRKVSEEKQEFLSEARAALLKHCFAVMPSEEFIEWCKPYNRFELASNMRKARQINIPDFRDTEDEIHSWEQSLPALARVMEEAKLYDQFIILEYLLPRIGYHYPCRIDAMILGKDIYGRNSLSLIENKRWKGNIIKEAKTEGKIWLREGDKEVIADHPCKQPFDYDTQLHDLFRKYNRNEDVICTKPYLFLHNFRGDETPAQNTAVFGSRSFELRSRVKIYRYGIEYFAASLARDVGGGRGQRLVKIMEKISMKRPLNENGHFVPEINH